MGQSENNSTENWEIFCATNVRRNDQRKINGRFLCNNIICFLIFIQYFKPFLEFYE